MDAGTALRCRSGDPIDAPPEAERSGDAVNDRRDEEQAVLVLDRPFAVLVGGGDSRARRGNSPEGFRDTHGPA